jgi:hypothetical protein
MIIINGLSLQANYTERPLFVGVISVLTISLHISQI